ncbi:WD40-repeat-containing domain protein [Fimicolochytrium jonesii]|uniref:WD40-repeat-containing domain protein n=1 Tax=Fimicolochytrium jonesii TaxID=1396493 RepID=UPI0022FE31D0|nr:WD40-repeat-containing domain protein [Fimicolochytrium jonesii]KAI8826764.1 WD40-repeat-containing domain protein [Fimicolochytrium jonesii]
MSTPIDIDYSFEHVELAPNVENCVGYDVTPFASCVHPTGINCVATTRNMRWIFTGGDDGYIRKFDFAATLFGGQILTQTQKHGLVDSIEKAGVLTSAWENQEFPASCESQQSLSDIAVEEWSPVYSIEVESEGVWCLSGCRSGNINLWSVRHDEGACRHVFRGHTSAVSVLKLTPGERGVISGSWDKTLLRWDLETGNIVRYFQGVTSLVTSASFSPTSASSYTIDPAIGDTRTTNVHPTAEDSLMMVTTYDGTILLYDQRDPNNVTRKFLPRTSGSSPWAYNATWSADGRKIYCGRRNNTVDVYDVAENRYVRNLKFPNGSGHVWAVSCMPNNRHLMCASQDILRLWDLDVATPSSDAPPAPSPSPIVAHPTSQSNDSGPNSTPGTPPSPAGDGKLLDPASAGGAGGVVITAGSTRTATTANLGRTASLLSAKEDELETPPLVPFTILPGHNGGVVSALIIDPSKRYMLTASGTRGWDGTSSNQCLLYCIDPVLAPAAAADDPAATPGADGAVGAGDEMDVDPVVVVVPDRVVGEEDVEDVEEGMVEQMVG